MKTRLKQFSCLVVGLVLVFALFAQFGNSVYVQADGIFIPEPTPAPGQYFEFEPVENIDDVFEIFPTPPPVEHILGETIPDSRPIVFMDDNPIINVLEYTESDAVQEIRNNLELYLDNWFMPNQEWIAQHTTDLSAYGNFVMVHNFNTTVAYCMNTIEPIMNFSVQDYDKLTKKILQVLNAPDTVIPTLEEIKHNLGLTEIPIISTATPFPIIDEYTGREIAQRNNADFERVLDTTRDPYYAVVHLSVRWPNGTISNGSGFLVNRTTVVTAGHLLYNRDRGGWATSIDVTPGRNANHAPYGTLQSLRIAAGGSWVINSDASGDFGVITLSSSANVPSHFFMLSRTDAQLQNLSITTTGFPGGQVPASSMQRSRGEITIVQQFGIRASAFGGPGMSGAPLYDASGWVVGILTSGVAGAGGHINAVRMIPDLIDFVLSW